MIDVCKYFDVVRAGEEQPDSLLVEKCGDFVSELAAFEIRVTNENALNVLQWAKDNLIVNASHLDKTFDSSKIALFKMITSMKSLGSFTVEIVKDAGGVSDFLAKYEGEAEPVQVPVPDAEEIDEVPDFETEGDLPILDEENDELFEELQNSLGESVTEVEEDDFGDLPVFIDEEEGDPFKEDKESEASFLGDDSNELLGGFVGVDDTEEEHQVASEPEELVTPFALKDGRQLSIPINQLAEVSEYILAAAKNLDTSDYAPEQALTADELQQAVEVVNDISPTLCKQFMMEYVRTAATEKDRIRVSSMLDQFVTYVSKMTGGIDYEK